MHHHPADDPATAAQLAPLHRGAFLTADARWPRRELILKAIRAVLDYQPLLVASVVEGLVQGIGYGGLFGHIFRPVRFQIKTAPGTLCRLVLLLNAEYHPPMSAVNGGGLR